MIIDGLVTNINRVFKLLGKNNLYPSNEYLDPISKEVSLGFKEALADYKSGDITGEQFIIISKGCKEMAISLRGYGTLMAQSDAIYLGIITALPKEYAAVKVLLNSAKELVVPGAGAGRRYILGKVPSSTGGEHDIILSLADKGNNAAAARATQMLQHFPSLESILMVGIAGGVPRPDDARDHVRLGDIVVSDENGIVEYDFVEETLCEKKPRFAPRPPSSSLLDALRHLEADSLVSGPLWKKYIADGLKILSIDRPDESTDILYENPSNAIIPHPADPLRTANLPRIFKGTIASSNTLLRNAETRDDLARKYKVKAVEMEGSGIAEATWNHDASYFVIRGICDYCDSHKNDVWQKYAAVVAAAFARGLIESIPCTYYRAKVS